MGGENDAISEAHAVRGLGAHSGAVTQLDAGVQTRAESDEAFDRWQRHWAERGFGLLAVEWKESGELIGDCGCVLQEVEGQRQMEIAYHVRRDLWGNGYATEAARACMDYAFERLGARRVISMIRPENKNSRRVAEKNGLACEKVVFWHGYDHCIYAKEKV